MAYDRQATESDCRPVERPSPCNGTSTSTAKSKTKCEPQCPDCGSLECLCRPRFFAGQLLTEQDLNRLDQYVKRKNQLHNRNLHGWGVVNGMMLVCDGCGGVKLTKGYAISPCGDDIVVCDDTPIPICDLIEKCREKQFECRPFERPPNVPCEDDEEEWVLAIRYVETPTRGITALRDSGCGLPKSGGTCACGKPGCGTAKSSGTCGCGKPGCRSGSCGCNGSAAKTTMPRGAPAQCEPTIICEGYAFDVYPKPEPDPEQDDDSPVLGGPLVERMMCCFEALFATIPTEPGDGATPADWVDWCCRFKRNLIRYFSRRESTNCELLAAVSAIHCPSANDDDAQEELVEIYWTFLLVIIEAMFDCFCLAMLPPVPTPTHDPRVPIATVKIRRKHGKSGRKAGAPECEVLSTCNWTIERKLLVGWPSLSYWLSIIPIGRWIHEALDLVCCTDLDFFRRGDAKYDEYGQPNIMGFAEARASAPARASASAPSTPPSVVAPPAAEPAPAPPTPPPGGSGGAREPSALDAARRRLNPTFPRTRDVNGILSLATRGLLRGKTPIEPQSFLTSVTRLKGGPKKETGSPLHDVERNNILQFLAFNTFARPFGVAALESPVMGSILALLAGGGKPPAKSEDKAVIDRLTELERKVATYEAAGARPKRRK